MGQFERTLIIVDEGAYVHYVEGLHGADLHDRLAPLGGRRDRRQAEDLPLHDHQNWSNNVYNLVTKRAVAYENATMEWVDGNLGSKQTMKYPAIWLMGEGAHGELLSIAFAGNGQHQDAGGKAVHVAEHVLGDHVQVDLEGRRSVELHRGLLEVAKGAHGARSKVVCDALILDEDSRTPTPTPTSASTRTTWYRRGHDPRRRSTRRSSHLTRPRLSEGGGADDRLRLRRADHEGNPLEYAVELNRLIQLQMEGSVG